MYLAQDFLDNNADGGMLGTIERLQRGCLKVESIVQFQPTSEKLLYSKEFSTFEIMDYKEKSGRLKLWRLIWREIFHQKDRIMYHPKGLENTLL